MAHPVVVLDADVLVPIVACDFLLTSFESGLFEPWRPPRWDVRANRFWCATGRCRRRGSGHRWLRRRCRVRAVDRSHADL